MGQNVYDNEVFFNGYRALRKKEDNYNDLLEQPAMIDLLPDLQQKTVLDLGCGYGCNCAEFIKRGAQKVIGVDISKRMLAVARAEYAHENIEYSNMDMTRISEIPQKFDFVYSSLAFHYIEDFSRLVADIYDRLNDGGTLLYSQEHPIITATHGGEGHFNRDENGNKVSYTFSNYNQIGKRETHWMIDGVVKYHRTMGEIVTTLAKAGFIIEDMVEPVPKDWALEKCPAMKKEFIKPNFLVIKARKQ